MCIRDRAAKGAILKQDVLINKSLSNEQTRMFEWGDSGMNANLTTILEGFQDPRLPLYMTKNQADVECEDGKTIVSGTQYLGIRGGCDLPAKPNQWGNFSKIVCSYTTALPVMMAAEGYFCVRKVRCVVGVTWEVRRRNCMSKVSVFLLRISWLIREVWPE